MFFLLASVAEAWTVPLPAAPVVTTAPLALHAPASAAQLPFEASHHDATADYAAAAYEPAYFYGPAPEAAPQPAASTERGGVFVALCGCGALLGYGYGLARRQQAALAVSGKRALGPRGLAAPVMQLGQQYRSQERRDAAYRQRHRSTGLVRGLDGRYGDARAPRLDGGFPGFPAGAYGRGRQDGGYGDVGAYGRDTPPGAYGPYRGGFQGSGVGGLVDRWRSGSGLGWNQGSGGNALPGPGIDRWRRRSAPNIFWEGLEELARDPLGWLDVDRPSYLRGAGSAGWSPRRGGRGLGDGVVSRTYGKRNLYESDGERAARQDAWNRPDGRRRQPEPYWERPGLFEGPKGYSRYDRTGQGYSGARRTADQSRFQAFEREDGKNDWMEGAQGPQTSIRRSEALRHASGWVTPRAEQRALPGARGAAGRALTRRGAGGSLGSGGRPADKFDRVAQANQTWARNAEARERYRQTTGGGSFGNDGRIVPSAPRSRSADYARSYGDSGWSEY